jgi:hypothetical protein
MIKPEIRISKSETIFIQITEIQMTETPVLKIGKLENSDLFRISDFMLRI